MVDFTVLLKYHDDKLKGATMQTELLSVLKLMPTNELRMLLYDHCWMIYNQLPTVTLTRESLARLVLSYMDEAEQTHLKHVLGLSASPTELQAKVNKLRQGIAAVTGIIPPEQLVAMQQQLAAYEAQLASTTITPQGLRLAQGNQATIINQGDQATITYVGGQSN